MSSESTRRRNQFMGRVYQAAEETQITKHDMLAALAHEIAFIAQEIAQPATHPMHCTATMPSIAGDDHDHHCDLPPHIPASIDATAGINGVPEHHCGNCSATWTERLAAVDELRDAPSTPEQP